MIEDDDEEEEEQARFAAWVQEQIQKAKRAAYEAEVYGEG